MSSVPEVRNLQTLLRSLEESTSGEDVDVAELLNAVGRRAYGPVLLLLGFIAISPLTLIPGASWLVALVTGVFAIQIVFGLKSPWLPKKALEFSFPRKHLLRGVDIGERYARRIDALFKPRLTFLTDAPFVQLVALVCVGAALITFPLGFIPFGPLLPGVTICLLGLGLTARDGFALIIGGAALIGAIYLLIRLWGRIMEILPFI